MVTRALLWLALGMLMSGCAAPASTAPAPLDAATVSSQEALSAAETGRLGQPAVVFFHADWCPICQSAKPAVADLAALHEGQVAFLQISMDDAASRAAISRYRVSATPTFVLLSARGDVLASIPGWPGKERLETAILQMVQ